MKIVSTTKPKPFKKFLKKLGLNTSLAVRSFKRRSKVRLNDEESGSIEGALMMKEALVKDPFQMELSQIDLYDKEEQLEKIEQSPELVDSPSKDLYILQLPSSPNERRKSFAEVFCGTLSLFNAVKIV